MKTLLSIDFDFFFPNPLEANKPDDASYQLYDWGHSESELYISMLWDVRAMSFLRNGFPLPMTSGEEEGFWGRFNFSRNAECYVHESHAYILNVPGVYGYDKIVNFDAHHDAGYNEDSLDILKTDRIDCGNWAAHLVLKTDTQVRVIYPRWKGMAETGGAAHISRRVDTGSAGARKYDGVFVCRSGAWVPSWCDEQFNKFLAACPVPVNVMEVYEREWDEGKVRESMKSLDEQMKKLNVSQYVKLS